MLAVHLAPKDTLTVTWRGKEYFRKAEEEVFLPDEGRALLWVGAISLSEHAAMAHFSAGEFGRIEAQRILHEDGPIYEPEEPVWAT